MSAEAICGCAGRFSGRVFCLASPPVGENRLRAGPWEGRSSHGRPSFCGTAHVMRAVTLFY